MGCGLHAAMFVTARSFQESKLPSNSCKPRPPPPSGVEETRKKEIVRGRHCGKALLRGLWLLLTHLALELHQRTLV